jgi:3-isopropylmalate/(R)-2-methylmalate dehydratase small subunit
MEAFKTFTGIVAVLDRGNVDTDQIISKEHLKSVKRTGFGPSLFSDWRYQEDGSENSDFELNQPRFQKAEILVTGSNFGCGSSREHAVWAIQQYGIKTIIAPRQEDLPAFADIFYNNSGKNGLLLIALSKDQVDSIIQTVHDHEGLSATVDLEQQKITLSHQVLDFSISPALKERLLRGLDDIGRTEQFDKEIQQFEIGHSNQLP